MLLACPSCGTTNRIPAERANQTAKCGRCKARIGPASAPVPMESVQEFRELVAKSPLPVLVDFWAPWCGPCHMVAPEVQKLARDHAGRAIVAKVDTEKLPELGAAHRISGIPTLVLFRGGAESARVSGAMSASAIARSVGL